jgi:hypothetical protein
MKALTTNIIFADNKNSKEIWIHGKFNQNYSYFDGFFIATTEYNLSSRLSVLPPTLFKTLDILSNINNFIWYRDFVAQYFSSGHTVVFPIDC